MRVQSAIVALVSISITVSCSGSTTRPGAAIAVSRNTNEPAVQLDSALRDTAAWHRNEWMIPGAAFATFTCESRRMAWDGVTRVDEQTPIGPHALFPVEWHAAPMLATAALRLERRGVLRLDAPLRELWPSAARRAPWYAEITLGELLSYTPPIPAYFGGDSASLVPRFSAGCRQSAAHRATRWFLAQRPDSIPSRWRGSGPAIVVAAGILEQVTGQPMSVTPR